MQWTGDALVLSVRPHGETAAIAELFTRERGRHLGLVQGGRSKSKRPVLQPGNAVAATWTARLASDLGQLTLELKSANAAQAMDDPAALAGLSSACAFLRLFAEQDPHAAFYDLTQFVFGYLDDIAVWPALYARWETRLLEELGFGLDLAACAATGATSDLIYVSPKSGRAVSAGAGAPYATKLLRLPQFLVRPTAQAITGEDVTAALTLTAYFLEDRILRPRGLVMPDTRERLPALLTRNSAT